MKAVQLLLNSFLPESLRDYNRSWDSKSVNDLLNQVRQEYPDRFADVTKKLGDVGRKSSYVQGLTITLDDLEPVIDKGSMLQAMSDELAMLNRRDPQYKNKRAEIHQKYNDLMEKETMRAALAKRNNIAMAVLSGARGKAAQAKAMISHTGTFSNSKGGPIDIFVEQSAAEGIPPEGLAAGSVGARASVISTKNATARGGDWAKQAAATSIDLVIRQSDCGTSNGIPLSVDDKSLKGRVLAKEAAGIPAGTVLDRADVTKLRKSGVADVVARSSMTCDVANGLCAHCVGKFYNGGKSLPSVGDSVGLMAATTLSEPITQMALCLAKGTLVRLPNGQTKEIQDIKVGDIVMGADTKGNSFPVEVTDTFDQGVKEVSDYEFNPLTAPHHTLQRVAMTKDHKLLTVGKGDKNKVKAVGELSKERVLGVESSGRVFKADVVCAWDTRQEHCYDIEVNHPDHLFVLDNGLIVSNSAKHTAGMSKGKKEYSGLEYISQFSQSPEAYKDKAAVSTLDGVVSDVKEAPQGGTYITVNGKQHYALPGMEILVKRGDRVESGDQLSDGLMDVEDVVRYKGIGAGRKYYADRLGKMLKDSGAGTDQRNVEMLARGHVRHVRVTGVDGTGGYLPNDLVDYAGLQATYSVPETAELKPVGDSIGGYLQAPSLYFSLGTRITPKVAQELSKYGVNDVLVDSESPDFKPELVRLRASSHTTDDWLGSMGTSYIKKQLDTAATRGQETNYLSNPDPRPRLMYGVGFGDNIDKTGEF